MKRTFDPFFDVARFRKVVRTRSCTIFFHFFTFIIFYVFLFSKFSFFRLCNQAMPPNNQCSLRWSYFLKFLKKKIPRFFMLHDFGRGFEPGRIPQLFFTWLICYISFINLFNLNYFITHFTRKIKELVINWFGKNSIYPVSENAFSIFLILYQREVIKVVH